MNKRLNIKQCHINNKLFLILLIAFQFLFLTIFSNKTFASESIEYSLKKCSSAVSSCEKIKALYRLIDFHPIWNEKRINEFKGLIAKSKFEGLEPSYYRIDLSRSIIDNELKLTNTLIKLAYHAYYGFINPVKVFEKWDFPKKEDKVIQTLAELIKNDNLSALFDKLSPKYENYRLLREHLLKYYVLLDKEKWNRIEIKGKIKQGKAHPAIPSIRKRLYLLGYLDSYSESTFFDEKLKQAVIKFQQLHNIEADAVIGRNTMQALNVSPYERIIKIKLNLEKYRWLPESLGEKFLWINIPSFELNLYDKSHILLQSRIIVGKNYKDDFRPTPLLFSKITKIIINPDWYIPHKIAVKDILPRINKNPDYLTKENIKVYLDGKEINSSLIDWSNVDEKNFNFRLVQKAGKSNALGQIKFHMPNNFDVYLHDTPDKKLFTRNKRAFSSGCIRVEKALPLALILIENNNTKNWDDSKIKEALKSEKTSYITLKNPIPVYIFYFTTLVKDSELYFFEDLYGYDGTIAKHLQKNY